MRKISTRILFILLGFAILAQAIDFHSLSPSTSNEVILANLIQNDFESSSIKRTNGHKLPPFESLLSENEIEEDNEEFDSEIQKSLILDNNLFQTNCFKENNLGFIVSHGFARNYKLYTFYESYLI